MFLPRSFLIAKIDFTLCTHGYPNISIAESIIYVGIDHCGLYSDPLARPNLFVNHALQRHGTILQKNEKNIT